MTKEPIPSAIQVIQVSFTADDGEDWELSGNEFVVGSSQPTDSAISTTESVFDTFSITIPTYWTTYDLHVIVSGVVKETGTATGDTSATWRIREGTTTAGTSLRSVTVTLGDAGPHNRLSVGLIAQKTGETATGTVSHALTDEVSANSADFTSSDFTILIYAFRTS